MVSSMRYGRHLSIPGAPHAFQALVPADARQYPLQMLWFPNIYSHLLRISISTEMLSETDSRNLLDFINLQDCLQEHLQATRSAWGWCPPALLHCNGKWA